MCETMVIVNAKLKGHKRGNCFNLAPLCRPQGHLLCYVADKLILCYLSLKGRQNSMTSCGKRLIRMWTIGGAQHSFYRWADLFRLQPYLPESTHLCSLQYNLKNAYTLMLRICICLTLKQRRLSFPCSVFNSISYSKSLNLFIVNNHKTSFKLNSFVTPFLFFIYFSLLIFLTLIVILSLPICVSHSVSQVVTWPLLPRLEKLCYLK